MKGLLSMQKVSSSYLFEVLPRAFLVLIICISLVAFSSFTAPKAQAEAVTLSLTTAFLMITIAVMSTLGVTLTASSVDDGVAYLTDPFLSFLQGKGYSSIQEYLASVGITAVTQLAIPVFGAVNIVKAAYDIIAEFCSSFFADNNVVSGGEDVGQVPTTVYPSIKGISTSNPPVTAYSVIPSSQYQNLFLNTRFNSFPNYFYLNDSYTLNVELSGSTRYIYIRERSSWRSLWSQAITLSFNNPQMLIQTRIVDDNIQFRVGTRNDSSMSPNIWGPALTVPAVEFYNTVYASSPSKTPGFVISPSATVLAPPQVATGQTYSIPSSGVQADDNIEDVIPALVAPLTTTGGLTKTATVAGSAVSSDLEWLYEDTQAIRQNTNPHFDFIPSALGFEFSIWHYVVEMMASVSDSFALLGTFINNMPPAVLVFPFGVFALAITVALLRRFLS